MKIKNPKKYSISVNLSGKNVKNLFRSSQRLLFICNLKLLPVHNSQNLVGIKKLLKENCYICENNLKN